jgi:hypothetical protein
VYSLGNANISAYFQDIGLWDILLVGRNLQTCQPAKQHCKNLKVHSFYFSNLT